jgi:cell division protein FtsQ
MKRILIILFWVAIIAYYFMSLSFVSARRHEQVCTAMEINILDSAKSRFVTKKDIHQMVENRSRKIVGVLLDSINTKGIERRLCELAPIRSATVYKTIDGKMYINVMQRTPIVRCINRYGESFYLDEQGKLLKHSSRYYAHALVANGYINLRPEQKDYSVFDDGNAAAGNRNVMRELFDLANYINGDRFWKAQIQQIYVNEEGEFELIPLVGAHTIVFGTFDKHDDKFSKLASFYRNGLNVKGWNTYDAINIKYEGQIVGTRKSNKSQ